MNIPISRLPKVRSKAIMKAARGQPCTLRIGTFIGSPCASEETTVACHLPVGGKGVGTKTSDLEVAFGCSRCHDLLDHRDHRIDMFEERYAAAYALQLLRAGAETRARLLHMGLIVVPGGEIV